LAGGVEDLEALRLRVVVKRRRDAVRGEDDRRLLEGGDLLHRAHAEVFHLLDHALVVYDLPENRAAAAAGGETLHLQIGDAHAGTEPILLRPLDPHRTAETGCRPTTIPRRVGP